MKFLNFIHESRQQIGILSADETKVLPVANLLGHERYCDMNRFIEQVTAAEMAILLQAQGDSHGKAFKLEEVTFLPPILRPKHDIICVGVNYASHRAETTGTLSTSLATQERPVIFRSERLGLLATMRKFRAFSSLMPIWIMK
jgi:2-keto-4-pentenoate hydratase/2-oxohepta-3-ene-1,7-dioic acid hydratase in catechol pathway